MSMQEVSDFARRERVKEALRGALMVTMPWLIAVVAFIIWWGGGHKSQPHDNWITAMVAATFALMGCITAPLYLRPYAVAWWEKLRQPAPMTFGMVVYNEGVAFRAAEKRVERVQRRGVAASLLVAFALTACHYRGPHLSWWWLIASAVPFVLTFAWGLRELHRHPILR